MTKTTTPKNTNFEQEPFCDCCGLTMREIYKINVLSGNGDSPLGCIELKQSNIYNLKHICTDCSSLLISKILPVMSNTTTEPATKVSRINTVIEQTKAEPSFSLREFLYFLDEVHATIEIARTKPLFKKLPIMLEIITDKWCKKSYIKECVLQLKDDVVYVKLVVENIRRGKTDDAFTDYCLHIKTTPCK